MGALVPTPAKMEGNNGWAIRALRLALPCFAFANVASACRKAESPTRAPTNHKNASTRDATTVPADDIQAPVSPRLAESLQATAVFRRKLWAVQVVAHSLHARAEVSCIFVDIGAHEVLVEQSSDMTDCGFVRVHIRETGG